jgi:hypothetical protein
MPAPLVHCFNTFTLPANTFTLPALDTPCVRNAISVTSMKATS